MVNIEPYILNITGLELADNTQYNNIVRKVSAELVDPDNSEIKYSFITDIKYIDSGEFLEISELTEEVVKTWVINSFSQFTFDIAVSIMNQKKEELLFAAPSSPQLPLWLSND